MGVICLSAPYRYNTESWACSFVCFSRRIKCTSKADSSLCRSVIYIRENAASLCVSTIFTCRVTRCCHHFDIVRWKVCGPSCDRLETELACAVRASTVVWHVVVVSTKLFDATEWSVCLEVSVGQLLRSEVFEDSVLLLSLCCYSSQHA